MNTDKYFSHLQEQLTTRSTRAVLSQLGIRSDALRNHLRNQFERIAGESGGFIADPVFEATFGWEPAQQTMSDLAGKLLHEDLVLAMDSPPEILEEQRFNMGWYPHKHQLEAWKVLCGDKVYSALITSGTGSGKTECFLVPILNDLAQEREKKGQLKGVRALFLYPLNALINSQRERLKAWTAAFKGDIRYCLYNSETPSHKPAKNQQETPQEILSRELLRSEPPPILVTNATMLEYMLVRNEDTPILNASQGHLRWIVLDEAHTYVGSQAAELALLLRRVLHAFGVKPEQVRFVATSATFSTDEESKKHLQVFLADVAGVKPEQVEVIEGHRLVPKLPEQLSQQDKTLPTLEKLYQCNETQRFEYLASHHKLRELRQTLSHKPETLRMLASLFFSKKTISVEQLKEFLALLDICTTAKWQEQVFLPLRGHIFHRTQNGLWACCNPDCEGKKNTDLDHLTWEFGALYMERREKCQHCDSQVFELVLCTECGTEYLAAEEQREKGESFLKAREFDKEEDEFLQEFELEAEEDEAEDIQSQRDSFPRFLGRAALVNNPTRINLQTGLLDDENAPRLNLLLPEVDGYCRCPACSKKEKYPQETFHPVRLGAPFLLSVTIPTLLESSPEGKDEIAQGPWQGRRLITFSDSRQGTARFALKAQLDAQRNHVRSVIYHQLARSRPKIDQAEIEKQRKEVDNFREIVKTAPIAQVYLDEALNKLNRLQNMTKESGQLSWQDLKQKIHHDDDFDKWIKTYLKYSIGDSIQEQSFSNILLFQEFLRRPKRLNSLETLGLIKLQYPDIVKNTTLPVVCKQLNVNLEDWNSFLKIIVDFYIRANATILIPEVFLRWLGSSTRKNTYLYGYNASIDNPKRQRRWPQYRGKGNTNRIIILLATALKLNLDKKSDANNINQILIDAWEFFQQKLLTNVSDKYLLNLEEKTEFREVQNAWICPTTHRILDTTFRGFTPYITHTQKPDQDNPDKFKCTPITMPRLPLAFWRNPDGSEVGKNDIQEWLETDEKVLNARQQAIWPELSDRIVSLIPYFRVAEHSAQQSGKKLRDYEKLFKQGKINVLSCSTTMEMGVDIGGLSIVAMNNAPPSPANFLQRAGRAGRRNESRSASLTLCKSTPHNEAVFRNPLWPFRTPIFVPQVSLQSEKIVSRHLNALALARFLALQNENIPRLTAGWFFEPPAEEMQSPAERFQDWCNEEAKADEHLCTGIKSLIQRSCLAGVSIPRLLTQIFEKLHEIQECWLEEIQFLEKDKKEFTGNSKVTTPAEKAINYQLRRIREEYLLSELAAKGFLPGYGFPNNVVPFVTKTLEELIREERQREQKREDNNQRYIGFPSRERAIALREYAPGADIVLDGKVYKSEGVTLNWHLPPGNQQSNEVQALRWAWRCKQCGATGTSSKRYQDCPSCGGSQLYSKEYLQPNGFAVNLGYQPHNDLSKNTYIPVQTPWITTQGEAWMSLPLPSLGRYRYSAQGHVFHWSAGLHNHGFAVCLRCGRADSEPEPIPENEGEAYPKQPDSLQGFNAEGHFRLRGGKETNGESRCIGNDEDYAIKRHLWLGSTSHTDVFELQILDDGNGQSLRDRTIAYSLAVALRQALAEKLGVDEREIGCDAVHTTTDNHTATYSIMLYDTASGGAGYVAAAANALPELFKRAKEILTCSCDQACHYCLLSFDSQHQIKYLNRNLTLSLLSEKFFMSLDLPKDMRFFGEHTCPEFEPLAKALRRELQRLDVNELRIYFNGELAVWDLLEGWVIKSDLIRWAAEGRTVRLFIEVAHYEKLDVIQANQLAGLVEIGGIKVCLQKTSNLKQGYLIAEAGSNTRWTRWAVREIKACEPNENWGCDGDAEYSVKLTQAMALPAAKDSVLELQQLRRSTKGNIQTLSVTTEFDGSIKAFGKSFWQRIQIAQPQLEHIISGQALVEVHYVDRYLKSPLTFKLLHSLLDALAIDSNKTKIIIETSENTQGKAQPYKIEHDWLCDSVRRQVAEKFLQAEFLCKNYRELPHARELTLKFDNGKTWLLRLDQGFGYWRTSRNQKFDFEKSFLEQVKQLQTSNFDIQASNQHPVFLYFGLSE